MTVYQNAVDLFIVAKIYQTAEANFVVGSYQWARKVLKLGEIYLDDSSRQHQVKAHLHWRHASKHDAEHNVFKRKVSAYPSFENAMHCHLKK